MDSSDGRSNEAVARLLRDVDRWRSLLETASSGASITDVQRAIDRLIFLRQCEARGIERERRLQEILELPDVRAGLLDTFRHAAARYGGLFALGDESIVCGLDEGGLRELLRALYSPAATAQFSRLPAETLGQVYEQYLGRDENKIRRKAAGAFYTPRDVAARLVVDTVGRACEGLTIDELSKLRILDPACGSGVFLLAAYRYLLEYHLSLWLKEPASHRRVRMVRSPCGEWTLNASERQRILLSSIHGVDQDPYALEITKLTLLLASLEDSVHQEGSPQLQLFVDATLPDWCRNFVCGNSLIAPDFLVFADGDRVARERALQPLDWSAAFPAIVGPGFDVVIGNPPWGQKQIVADGITKDYLRQRFPSSRGIFDWFRPFVEASVRLLRPSGRFGMVLPDIVLLKDYEPTRRFLLDHLTLEKIQWLGMAFAAATIDTVTISGQNARAKTEHRVDVVVHDPERPLVHNLPQRDFRENLRCTFNLFLTDEKRDIVRKLAGYPKLGDYFEPHEGIHSGNIRDDLFVSSAVDETCRELLFGRDELAPYALRWAGRYVRLGAFPVRKSPDRYANLGKPEWHESRKVLVRRTGDRVTAAVDEARRYASNNFFLVVPSRPCALSLDGLCALLNSRLITWFFRTIEPREGRAFAELKIKHLVEFPLPDLLVEGACTALNDLGSRQREIASISTQEWAEERGRLSEAVQSLVLALFRLRSDPSMREDDPPPQVLDRRTA